MLEFDLLLDKSITDLSLHFILQVTINLTILLSAIAVEYIYIYIYDILSSKNIQLLRPDLKCVGLLTPNRVYKKCVGQKKFF